MSLSSYHFCKMQYLCTYLLVSIAGSRDVGTLWFWDHIRGYLPVSVTGSRDVGTLWFGDHVRGYLFVSVAGTRDVGILYFEVSSGLPKEIRRKINFSAIR